MSDVLLEILLKQRVPFQLWVIIVIISLGLALIGLPWSGDSSKKTDETSHPHINATQAVSELMGRILDAQDEVDLKRYLFESGVEGDQAEAFIALATLTLETMFSDEEDRQTAEGMVAYLTSKGISRELAAVLLMNASDLLRARTGSASDASSA